MPFKSMVTPMSLLLFLWVAPTVLSGCILHPFHIPVGEKELVHPSQVGGQKAPDWMSRTNGDFPHVAPTVDGNNHLSREFRETVEEFQTQLKRSLEDFQQLAESEEFQRLQQHMARLMEEMRQTQMELQQKMEKDVLPRLRKEMEKLREMLNRPYGEDKAELVAI